MATQWLKGHLGSLPGLFFISSFRLRNRVCRYPQGLQSILLYVSLLNTLLNTLLNRINNLTFAFIATIQLQISPSALSRSFYSLMQLSLAMPEQAFAKNSPITRSSCATCKRRASI